ncbi:MAG: dTDP-4-dehydrorhamnose reductase [Candidatus Micrarchaeia archaeon]
MNKLLIIGASGLLGSKLYESCSGNYEVHGTYNGHKSEFKNMHQLDVVKRDNVFKLFDEVKPDFVIDTHAISNVDYCELHQDEAWRINVDGTKNVAEACKINGCKLVFISTDYVYDGTKATSYSEKDKPHPINYYGKTKLIAEKVIETLDLDYIIARTAVLFGISKSHDKTPFSNWVVDQLKAKKEINVVIDQYSNPTLINNLSDAIISLYEKDKGGLFNIAGKDTISRYEFAKIIAKEFDLDERLIKPITTSELNQPAKRPQKVALNVSKSEKAAKIKMLGVADAVKTFRVEFEKVHK